MTKKELKWQVDDQQDQINELRKRIAILENKTYWTWTTQPQPYVSPQITYIGDPVPSPGSTHNQLGANAQHRDNEEQYGNK